MRVKKITCWILVLTISVLIKLISLSPDMVEKYYSTGIYPLVSRLLRLLFGWLPFSAGDLFYGVAAVYLLYTFISFLRKLGKRQINRKYLLLSLERIILWVLVIYIAFNLLWGMNYNRRGLAYQLKLDVKPYSTEELTTVLKLIILKLNSVEAGARANRNSLKSKAYLFQGAVGSYHNLAANSENFAYPSPSVKPSVYSYLGDYLGFTGYYNPFSGEAQVNTTVPLFVQPFTTCHEIGHQLGYAKEDEANFAGYLSAKASLDPAFQYSAYFDLYFYAAGELYVRDSTLLKPLRQQLSPGIRKDAKELQEFLRRYENPFEPLVRRLYGKYLRVNEQPQGMMTYNAVISRLIAYYHKFGPGAL